jgi:hypothetical protein
MIRTIGKVVLVLFLLWHMFAVAVYSVPRDSKDVFGLWAQIDLIPLVSPYMFVTSQWQLWNIFSPDPLRRVTSYRIEIRENERWRELITIEPDAYSIFRHSTRLKLMLNILDEFKNDRAPYAGRFMHLLCADYKLEQGTPIRLIYHWYVLPQLAELRSRAWWEQWSSALRPVDTLGFTTTCP